LEPSRTEGKMMNEPVLLTPPVSARDHMEGADDFDSLRAALLAATAQTREHKR